MSPVQGWAWLQDRHGYRAGMGQVDPPHEVAQASRVLAAAGPQWGQSVSVTKWEPGSRTQLCPTLSDPMDCSPPGSSVHGIFSAKVLEWGAIAFSALETTNALRQYHS